MNSEPPNTVIARKIEKISNPGIKISVLYVKSEKFTTKIAEIKKLKKVLLSLRSLDENKLNASIMKARFIEMNKFKIIAFII
jgi:hypothetical protein